jgi:hypothetical protein
MGGPVLFETVVQGGDAFPLHMVRDAVTRVQTGCFNNSEDANYRRDFANNEHACGRVAQGRCQLGHACDRDRIHVPRMLRPYAEVILCDVHADEIDPIRGADL